MAKRNSEANGDSDHAIGQRDQAEKMRAMDLLQAILGEDPIAYLAKHRQALAKMPTDEAAPASAKADSKQRSHNPYSERRNSNE